MNRKADYHEDFLLRSHITAFAMDRMPKDWSGVNENSSAEEG